MVGMIRDRAVAEKYNIAIEGTFRTSEIPLRELQTFTSSGYTAHVIICTCPAELSWQSTITRAKKMEDGGFPSRYVPREHYDTVVGQLAHNVQIIYDSALAADLQIISREKILFNSASEADRNADITVTEVINRELNRQITNN
jgi:UDP-N-acetylglucosamine kinase